MSQAGIVDVIGTHPEIPILFVCNVGSAMPIGNTLELLAEAVAAHSIPLETVGSGNTVEIEVQYASAASSSIANNAGVASFNSTDFTVDANGYVSFTGGIVTENFEVDAFTSPGTNPVDPNGSGTVTVTGGQVAAGTTSNVIRTNSLAANTYTIQIQRSQAVSSSTVGDNGVSHFNSTYFTVDSNGFVSINGSGLAETITGNSGGALSPTAGNWNIFGSAVAAGMTPVTTSGTGSTLTVEVQRSQAIASTNASNVGLAAFNSTYFTVDSNGFVSINGSGLAETITGNTGGALSPTAGNWNILGTSTAAGSTPVQTSGSGSTLTIEIQKAQAIASTNVSDVGLAAFNSTYFTVDANGFVSVNGSALGETITGNTGGALSPTAGNWNIFGTSTAAGSTPVQTSGSGSTLTVQVQKAQAIVSTNASNVGLAAFNSSQFSVDANGYVTSNSFVSINITTFTSSGTYTPTSGMLYCIIEVVGGGGGSSGCPASTGGSFGGGGGGAGGYARLYASAATIGASQTVTIGAAGAAGTAGNNAGGTGGTTSVGSLVSATGGVGGSSAAAGTATSGAGGAGGVGSGGSFNTNGAPGANGWGIFVSGVFGLGIGGQGGSSLFGGGGASVYVSNGGTAAANAGTVYGSGGGGGVTVNTSAVAGAAGSAGLVIITEYI